MILLLVAGGVVIVLIIWAVIVVALSLAAIHADNLRTIATQDEPQSDNGTGYNTYYQHVTVQSELARIDENIAEQERFLDRVNNSTYGVAEGQTDREVNQTIGKLEAQRSALVAKYGECEYGDYVNAKRGN